MTPAICASGGLSDVEGPKAPRNYQFVARGSRSRSRRRRWWYLHARARVARIALAAFTSTRRLARFVSPIKGSSSPTGLSFGSVVFEPHRPSASPADGSLLLDHLTFRVRALDASGNGFRRAGSPLMCSARSAITPGSQGCGVQRRSRPRPQPTGARFWACFPALRSASSVTRTPACCERSRSAGRKPNYINASGTFSTHLSGFAKETRTDPSPELEELTARAEGALVGPSFWQPFTRLARGAGNESLIAGSLSTVRRSSTFRSPSAAVATPGRYAANDGCARPDNPAHHHGPLPPTLRAQEPRQAEPTADAPAATHQRGGRPAGVRQNDPRLVAGKRRAPHRSTTRDRRSRRLTFLPLTG